MQDCTKCMFGAISITIYNILCNTLYQTCLITTSDTAIYTINYYLDKKVFLRFLQKRNTHAYNYSLNQEAS